MSYSDKITVLELIDNCIKDHINRLSDRIQYIENMLFVISQTGNKS